MKKSYSGSRYLIDCYSVNKYKIKRDISHIN